jgi:glyoxylase-like metal-dependent hydrolase (beta-lactamase superfamily II)
MEVAHGVYRFDTGRFNWYLISEGDRLTLVDAGFPGHLGVLQAGLRKLNRQVSDIKAIVLTHSHADHTGMAQRVSEMSGAKIYLHRSDFATARRGYFLPWFALASNAWRPNTCRMLVHATVNGVFGGCSIRSELTAMSDGDVLDVPGAPRVIHTPGHTPGHVALWLADRRVLLGGDSVTTMNVVGPDPDGPMILPSSVTAEPREAIRSIERFRELGNLTLLTGHGPTWTGTGEQVGQLASHRRAIVGEPR